MAVDTRPAEWLVADICTFAESVLSLVPSGFDAYVRVFHLGYRRKDGASEPVRWAEIAAATGTRAHAGMQLTAITRNQNPHLAVPGIYDDPPRVGALPEGIARQLASVLRGETSTPGRCWFGLWDGYGAARESEVALAPRFHLPHRDYHLLEGPIDELGESVLDPPLWQTANLCWPDDHAWCLATEIDLDSTYLACDARCRAAILSLREIEASSIDPATGISFSSDEFNV